MHKTLDASRSNLKQIQDLKILVSRGEGAALEFKKKASFPEKIVREMIAFANTKGGVVLIGVDDNGTLSGLKYPEDEAHVIRKALKKARPLIQYNEHFIPLGNSKTIIQYRIPESKRKPHHLLLENGESESYVRMHDKSMKASREMIEVIRHYQKQQDIHFQYGDDEKKLMTYLDKNKSITLQQFIALTQLKNIEASKKLVRLVLADVLRITPDEKGDYFSLAFRA